MCFGQLGSIPFLPELEIPRLWAPGMMRDLSGIIWALGNAPNLPSGDRETWEGQGIFPQLALPLLTGGNQRKEMNERENELNTNNNLFIFQFSPSLTWTWEGLNVNLWGGPAALLGEGQAQLSSGGHRVPTGSSCSLHCSLWPWEVTPAPGKLEFPALVIWNPSDALLRGWKHSWVPGERSSSPSSCSFLWSKQTAGVCFPTRGQLVNKSQGSVLVFINFGEERKPQDVFAQRLAQLGLDLSGNIHVQVLLFSF